MYILKVSKRNVMFQWALFFLLLFFTSYSAYSTPIEELKSLSLKFESASKILIEKSSRAIEEIDILINELSSEIAQINQSICSCNQNPYQNLTCPHCMISPISYYGLQNNADDHNNANQLIENVQSSPSLDNESNSEQDSSIIEQSVSQQKPHLENSTINQLEAEIELLSLESKNIPKWVKVAIKSSPDVKFFKIKKDYYASMSPDDYRPHFKLNKYDHNLWHTKHKDHYDLYYYDSNSRIQHYCGEKEHKGESSVIKKQNTTSRIGLFYKQLCLQQHINNCRK